MHKNHEKIYQEYNQTKANKPMIKKIKNLKDFGIFYDFKWKDSISEFQKFNLIYGWNASGKTTLSRIFSACEKKSIEFNRYPKGGTFELETDKGIIESHELDKGNLQVRVFNKDFVEENVFFDSSKASNPIVYISVDDISIQQNLKKLKEKKKAFDVEKTKLDKNIKDKQSRLNSFLTEVGRWISQDVFDKTYNKTKLEKTIKESRIDDFTDHVLSDQKLEENKSIGQNQNKSTYKKKKNFPKLRFFSVTENLLVVLTSCFLKSNLYLRKKFFLKF